MSACVFPLLLLAIPFFLWFWIAVMLTLPSAREAADGIPAGEALLWPIILLRVWTNGE